jgi:uncharacterized linocin/CFP29 family protein
MKGIRAVFSARALAKGLNTTLTQDDIRHVKKEIINAVLPTLRGRELLPINKEMPITAEFVHQTTETRMGAAVVRGRRTTHSMDDELLETLGAALAIPYIEKKFQFHRLDVLSKNNAKDRTARGAGRRVAEGENDLIYNGATLPAINGLIAGAGNTTAATAVWSSAAGTAFPYEDVNRLIGLMEADGMMGPYKMRVEPVNMSEFRKREVVAGGSGESFLSLVKGSLISDIESDPSLPHGTSVVIQASPDVAELAMPEDITVEFLDKDEMDVFHGRVYERCVPWIHQADGVGTITGM